MLGEVEFVQSDVSKRAKYVFAGVILFLLSLTLSFPLSHDNSIFQRGGEVILQGGKLYKDYIDIKPPLIYYTFAFSDLLFGYSSFSVRLFDLIYQLVTLLVLYRVCISESRDALFSWACCLLYTSLYVSFNNSTAQCETFATLPLLGAFALYRTNPNAIVRLFCAGACIGIAGGYKYTLLSVAIVFAIDAMTSSRENVARRLTNVMFLALGSTLALCATVAPLMDTEVRQGYELVFNYLMFYANLGAPFLSTQYVKDSLFATSYYLANQYSIIVLGGAFISITSLIIGRLRSHNKALILFSSAIIFSLFIGILVERKFAIYHYYRLTAFYSIVSAFGLVYIYREMRLSWDKLSTAGKYIIVGAVSLLLVTSPVVRLVNVVRISYCRLYDAASLNMIYDQTRVGESRTAANNVADYIRMKASANDSVHISSMYSSYIYSLLDRRIPSRFGNTQFYVSDGIPEKWKQGFVEELRGVKWLAIQMHDASNVNGHDKSSWQVIQTEVIYRDIVQRDFQLVETIGDFRVLKRIEPG